MQDFKKTDYLSNLLDLYGSLLTDKQLDVMNLYFNYDLSLSEISEQFQVSRNAIFDLIKRTSKCLEEYEEKLHLLKKRKRILKIIEPLETTIKEEIEKNI